MSKPTTSRGWICAFFTVPVLAILAISSFIYSPARRGATARPAAVPSRGIATPTSRLRVQANYAALPLAFEQNQGQTDPQVKFMARGDGYLLFLTANDAVFSLQSRSDDRASELSAKNPGARNAKQHSAPTDSTVVRMQLAGGNPRARVSASGLLPGKSNYFLGNDPSKWHSNVPHYGRVSYQDVYPGVNLAFHGAQRQTEFDFVVAPKANPAPIAFHFTGAQAINTDDSGNLIISSSAGNVLLHKPVAYQEQNGSRQIVDARFVLKAGNQVSFELGTYDRSRELVIDPSVSYAYSAYLGGSGTDRGQGIAFDNTGAAYVTGQTASTNFPGASNKLIGTAGNVFVTKIGATGSNLIYSTYVGGTGAVGDSGNAIAVDASGNAIVTGGTSSADFPVTDGSTYGAGAISNAFILKIGTTGTLTYSTFLGGTGDDVAFGIALDPSTNVFAAVGTTSSTDFPTVNALQKTLNGTSNGFVTVWNSSDTKIYSTFLGGGSGDSANAVALDSSDNAYVTGKTSSPSFPTKNPVQPKCGSDGTCNGGLSDAFVTVFNSTGSAYIYSTFLGGSGLDAGNGIAVDASGNSYVTGVTESTDFPFTTGVVQLVFGGGTSDAFVTKLNPTGSALVYSTYLGGSGNDIGASIAVDGNSNAYVTGQTDSPSGSFPLAGATQASLGGGFDAFVSEIDAGGSQLIFSTYLGGSRDEDSGGDFGAIGVDSAGANIYVTGSTTSTDFPHTSGFFQMSNGGGTDAFVVKYSQTTFDLAATAPAAVNPGTSGTSTVTLTAINGYSSPVNLSCSVSGTGSPAPACSASSFSPASPVTPTASGATTTLTIATTGPTGAMFVPRKIFYAMLLPITVISLAGISSHSVRSRRKKLLSFLMLGMLIAALLAIPACGGGSKSSGGGGGGGGGTPAGSYTVTITGTGTDTPATVQSTQITLTVN